MMDFVFTSESVTEGHPDKVCDQISDGVLDEILAVDPDARVACEVAATTGLILVMGEITTTCYVDVPKVARQVLERVGYVDPAFGFDAKTCAIVSAIDEQSSDIAMGVDASYDNPYEAGAGDQGMMFGFACDETQSLMPLPIVLAHELTKRLARVRKDKFVPFLGPDGKAQVSVEYRDGRPYRLDTVVVSTQHRAEVSIDDVREAVREHVIKPAISEATFKQVASELSVDEKTKIYVNPTGRFVLGGPCADSGLTGRKIIVDTYGGYARHGGGAFSGKDPTKVDRSASYAARHVAKNIVAAGLAKKCEVQVAYAIGVAEPVSIMIETFGTGRLPDHEIAKIVRRHFDLRPRRIIDSLRLRRPIYSQVAAYGHMGREDLGVSWEKYDNVEELREYLSR